MVYNRVLLVLQLAASSGHWHLAVPTELCLTQNISAVIPVEEVYIYHGLKQSRFGRLYSLQSPHVVDI